MTMEQASAAWANWKPSKVVMDSPVHPSILRVAFMAGFDAAMRPAPDKKMMQACADIQRLAEARDVINAWRVERGAEPASDDDEDYTSLEHHVARALAALAPVPGAVVRDALEELCSAVFGDKAGDEPDVYADYDKLIALKRRCLSALAAPAFVVPDAGYVTVRMDEMTDDMMNAGQSYLDSKTLALNARFTLPATFNWNEFWQAILSAAPGIEARVAEAVAAETERCAVVLDNRAKKHGESADKWIALPVTDGRGNWIAHFQLRQDEAMSGAAAIRARPTQAQEEKQK